MFTIHTTTGQHSAATDEAAFAYCLQRVLGADAAQAFDESTAGTPSSVLTVKPEPGAAFTPCGLLLACAKALDAWNADDDCTSLDELVCLAAHLADCPDAVTTEAVQVLDRFSEYALSLPFGAPTEQDVASLIVQHGATVPQQSEA